MAESFDVFEYLSHLRRHWKLIALSCAVALAIAGTVSAFLPVRYTATARIMIDPPGGDQRVAVAVSPIYLESLRTYENFASGDSLFARALDHFGMRKERSRGFESWKRSVLKVSIPRNTKVLEINATLPDPRKAHALALYLAQETVNLSRQVNLESDQPLFEQAQREAAEASERLDRITREYTRSIEENPGDTLQGEIHSAQVLKEEMRREEASTAMMMAEASAREKMLAGSGDAAGGSPEAQSIRNDVLTARARMVVLRERIEALDREILRKQTLAAERMARSTVLHSQRDEAQTAFVTADKRVQDIEAARAYHGEQLTIIDPGVTPERPSSPNIPLILVAAFSAGLMASLVFVTVVFGLKRYQAGAPRPAFRMAGHDA